MYTEDLARAAEKGFTTLWRDSVERPNDQAVLQAIFGIQRGIHCCGQNGPNDWTARPGFSVPDSCCEEGTATGTCNASNSFQSGCSQVLFELVKDSGLLIAWIAVSFAAFEVR